MSPPSRTIDAGGRPRRPAPMSRTRAISRSNEPRNADQCSRSSPWRTRSPRRAAPRPQAPEHGLVPGLGVVERRAQQHRQRVPDQQVVEVAAHLALEPAPLLLVHHLPPAAAQHAALAAVEHHQARAAEVAGEAPQPAALALGLGRELAQHRPRVVRVAHVAVDLVALERGRRLVAEVLIDPVGGQRARDPFLPPRLARISSTQASEVFQSSCTSWSSKIIAVGTVENSQRRVGSLQASQ